MDLQVPVAGSLEIHYTLSPDRAWLLVRLRSLLQ